MQYMLSNLLYDILHAADMLLLAKPLLGILLLVPCFSFIILFHMFIHVTVTATVLKTRDSLKMVICLNL